MQLWIDNTTLHGTGRCLTGEGRTSRDLRAFLQFATFLVFAERIELGGFEQGGVAALSTAIRSAVLNLGLPSDSLEIVPTSQEDYLTAAQAAARVAARELPLSFRADEAQILGLDALDIPTGTHFRPDRFIWLATQVEDPSTFEQVALDSIPERAVGAVDYMMATSDNLRLEVRRLIKRTPNWSELKTFQVESYFRSVLNDNLARQRGGIYAPAPHRGELVQRQNLWLAQQLGGVVDKSAERLRGESLGAPAILQALVSRSRGDPVGLLREALEFRQQAAPLRERFSDLQSRFDGDDDPNVRFAMWLEIKDLARAMRADLRLDEGNESSDPVVIELSVGLPSAKLAPTKLMQWVQDRVSRARRTVLTNLAKSAAFADNPANDLRLLVKNSMLADAMDGGSGSDLRH